MMVAIIELYLILSVKRKIFRTAINCFTNLKMKNFLLNVKIFRRKKPVCFTKKYLT